MRPCTRPTDRRGSIVLALLVALLVGGAASVLFVATVFTQNTARFDAGFTLSIHAAETGLQHALAQIRSGTSVSTGLNDVGEVENGSFVWKVTDNLGGGDWEVTATGTVDGITRELVATISDIDPALSDRREEFPDNG